MAEEKKFFNYENNFIFYKSKTAMSVGVIYFNKGYQSTPALALQFANVNEGSGGGDENKTFNWSETKTYWFNSFDKIYEFLSKINRWKNVISYLKKQKIEDMNKIKDQFKEMADKQKISNPMKKTNIYIMPRFYNGSYYLGITFSGEITVTLTEEELDTLIKYIDGYVNNYHLHMLIHRLVHSSIRSNVKPDSDENVERERPNNQSSSRSNSNSGGNKGKQNNTPSFDPEGNGVDNEIEEIMNGIGDFDDAI